MWEIFENLLKIKGVKVSEVASATGINNAFFTDWKKGRKKEITTGNAKKIADYFGVTVEYLITGEDTRTPTPDFDPDMIDLITCYSRLSDENKKMILELVKKLGGVQ